MKVGELKNKLNMEIREIYEVEAEMTKIVRQRHMMDAQLNENTVVRDELNLLKDDATVYKCIGPVLLKTDLIESKHFVNGKIEYLDREIKKADARFEELEKKKAGLKESSQKLEMQIMAAMR